MSDEILNETFEELPEDHPVKKALLAERIENRALKARAALLEVQSKYPTLGLVPDDFENLTPDKYEARAVSLYERYGKTIQTPGTVPPDTGETGEHPDRTGLATLERTGGTGSTPPPPQQITRKELEALRRSGKISLDDAASMLRKGQVKLDHVALPKAPF